MSTAHILVVDDEPDIRQLVQEILQDEGYEVSVAEDAAAAREARQMRRPDLTLLDIWMPDTDGITLLKEWAGDDRPQTPVIMMSGHGTVETAVEATRLGAYDFIEKPLSMAKLLLSVRHGLESARLSQENDDLRSQVGPVSEPIGRSEAMQSLREQLQRIAPHNTSVLLRGEAGTGKDACARYLHEHSHRGQGPFVAPGVSGLAGKEAPAQLFGSEADGRIHYGWMEQANGGTLFLNDIADLDLEMQGRLLNAIQHQSVKRVHGQENVNIDVRIVVGTRHNLAEAVAAGSFREDLYYQLNVVPIDVPPLREHCEDVPELLEFFVNYHQMRENLTYRHFSLAAQNTLRNYSWPGNTRELRNLIQRLLILGNDEEISQEEVTKALGAATAPMPAQAAGMLAVYELPLREARDQFEKAYLEHHLELADGNVSQVAKRAGVERTHLYRKLRSLGLGPRKK